ncbi:apolipoprotein N-acyltransferase [Halofilum ochraceum]|uniref:apolipoprotein N-acyltransferase n=1 Tax=Halofilum ochraceum TaxID=1611323 RepID=UPI00082C13AC|nr:apolipoprotein N-acyltransferase [Halofilum ochraceum]
MAARAALYRRQRLRAALTGTRARDLLALAAGAALAFAFAPWGVWPLAIASPAILFILWLDCTRRRAAWRGWLFGVGVWGAGVYWIYHSLHLFGAAVAPLAGALTVGFILALALIPAALGALVVGRDAERRGAAWFLLVLPGAWVLIEWVRSWLLTGFPWLLLGTSQTDSWLAGYAPVFGVYGMSLAVALSAGALAYAWRGSWHGRTLALVVAVGIWGTGAVLSGTHWSRAGGQPFDAALIQGNIEQEQKFNTQEKALTRYEDLTREVAHRAELVIWPETAVPTFYRRVADRLNEFGKAMETENTRVVTGVFTLDPETRRYYNAVRPLGINRMAYRKQRLVPFGEYMPLRSYLEFLERYIQIPMSDIAPGVPGQAPLEVGANRLGASVCYEAAYPGVIRRMAVDANVLVNVSNDGWFGDSTAPHQHLQIARLRSMETARPMLRATNTGITAIIDHQGEVISRGPQFEVAVVEARIDPRAGLTPYVQMGDIPALGAAAALAFLPYLIGAWRRRTGTA